MNLARTCSLLRPLLAIALACTCLGATAIAQEAVIVSAAFHPSQVQVGQTALFRVHAQAAPSIRDNADRIFSWYIDLESLNPSLASALYESMLKPSSDNDPATSATGFDDAPARRAIHDTFLNLPGAGVAEPVLLLEVPVLALAPGVARFTAAPGSGAPALSHDFIVAPATDGPFFSGGDYSSAFADLEVIQDPGQCPLRLRVTTVAGSPLQILRLTFDTCPGYNHTLQFRDAFGSAGWQPWPGAPHNSGSLVLAGDAPPHRFFRVIAEPRPGP